MSYLLDRQAKRKKIVVRVLTVFSLALLLFFRASVWHGLSYLASGAFYPVVYVGNGLKTRLGNIGAYFYSKTSLTEENERLLAELREKEAQMLDHDILTAENQSLKEVLERKKTTSSMILGGILSKPNQSAYDTLIIDAGASEGVQDGQMVYAYGEIPIGKISSVNPFTSTVVLFSSSRERTTAVISGASIATEHKNVFYDLVGRGGGNFEMILPREINPEKGDHAVLPGFESSVVATVESIISDVRDPFTKVLFVSPVNIQELKFVQVKK